MGAAASVGDEIDQPLDVPEPTEDDEIDEEIDSVQLQAFEHQPASEPPPQFGGKTRDPLGYRWKRIHSVRSRAAMMVQTLPWIVTYHEMEPQRERGPALSLSRGSLNAPPVPTNSRLTGVLGVFHETRIQICHRTATWMTRGPRKRDEPAERVWQTQRGPRSPRVHSGARSQIGSHMWGITQSEDVQNSLGILFRVLAGAAKTPMFFFDFCAG